LTPLTSFLEVCKRHFYREKMQNLSDLRNRIISVTDCVTSEMLANICEGLNIVLMCVMSLMVPILNYTEHTRYGSRLQSSWTQLITPNRSFVEVR
jgi:hypothetical protein